MAATTVNVDTAPARRALRRASDALGGRRAQSMFDQIGQTLVASTIARFESGRGPDGAAWKPSRRALEEGGKTLVDKGLLRNSITHRAGARGVDVGTNVLYGAIHQFGGRAGRNRSAKIPARPYLGVDDEDARAIERIAEAHLRRAAR